MITLEQLVPQDHLVRKVAKVIDASTLSQNRLRRFNEQSFAGAKQHHGHRYARYRALSKVQMQCFLAAMAQNIKKIALVLWDFLRFYGSVFINMRSW